MRKVISFVLGLALTLGGVGLFIYMWVNQSQDAKILYYAVPGFLFALGAALLWEDTTDFFAPRRYASGKQKALEDITDVVGQRLSYAEVVKRRPLHWSDINVRDPENIELQAYREAWADQGVKDANNHLFWNDFIESAFYRAGWKVGVKVLQEQGQSPPHLNNELEWILAYERAD